MKKRICELLILSVVAGGTVLSCVSSIRTERVKYEKLSNELNATKQTAEQLLASNSTLNAVNASLEKAIKNNSNSVGKNIRPFKATAYAPFDNKSGMCNDGDPNRTASGMKPGTNVFAVDPSVIPLGTKMSVVFKDGSIIHGVAGDTGGLIKGNKVDIFKYTYEEIKKFGRQDVLVIW